METKGVSKKKLTKHFPKPPNNHVNVYCTIVGRNVHSILFHQTPGRGFVDLHAHACHPAAPKVSCGRIQPGRPAKPMSCSFIEAQEDGFPLKMVFHFQEWDTQVSESWKSPLNHTNWSWALEWFFWLPSYHSSVENDLGRIVLGFWTAWCLKGTCNSSRLRPESWPNPYQQSIMVDIPSLKGISLGTSSPFKNLIPGQILSGKDTIW